MNAPKNDNPLLLVKIFICVLFLLCQSSCSTIELMTLPCLAVGFLFDNHTISGINTSDGNIPRHAYLLLK